MNCVIGDNSRSHFVGVGAMVLALVLTVRPSAQEPTFRSRADNVPVFATVVDKAGRLVTDLTRDAFQVMDDGKPQTLTVFDKTPQPVRLIVLVDISGSVAGNFPLVRAATQELIAHLAPGDLARVGTFGDAITISPSFTRDESLLMAALPTELRPNGRTPLWQAVDQAMGEFKSGAGRAVILVLSDGKDSGPIIGRRWLTSIEINERAAREDVMIYGVGVQSRGGKAMMPRAGENMAAIIAGGFPDPALGTVALNSGGGYFELRARDDLSETFARVVDELHQQYLLGFTPGNRDGKTHKIEVRVDRQDVKIRARKTYRAER